MVSGHLQQKKGNWYIILNLHDETGKRAPKWIATHLTVQGNKRRAEEMLLQARQQYTDIYGQHLLFHISNHPFIKFPGGVLMKNPTLILTEQRQSNDKSPISTIIQQAITVWLTKELSK